MQRLAADPGVAQVLIGIERPVEGREEPHVEDLQDDHQSENRSGDPGQEASSGGGHDDDHGDEDETLERESHERARGEVNRLVRSDEGAPHEQKGEGRERCGNARSPSPASVAGGSGDSESDGGVRARRRSSVRGVPVAPEPPHVAAERLGKKDERGDERGLGHSRR